MAIQGWLEATDVRHGLEMVRAGVTVHDERGVMVHANRAAAELLGWRSAEEVPIDVFAARWRVELADRAELPVSRALAGNDVADVALAMTLASGVREAMLLSARGVRDGSGDVMGVVQTLLVDGDARRGHNELSARLEQSTPVLRVGHGLLLQPLIGTLDSERAAVAMEKLLETIGGTAAKVAIVDITGVSAVDTSTANHLLRSLAAARLLGCEVVLSGVSPPIARTITVLGVDLSALRTKRDVAAAIEFGRRWVDAADAGAIADAGMHADGNGFDGATAAAERDGG